MTDALDPRPLAVRALLAATLLGAPAAFAQSGDPAADTALAYCTNLADEAADARYAQQLARLRQAESAIETRLVALADKRAEVEGWLTRREQFLARAQESLVSIYAGMRPDAASAQLAAMDEFTAAAVIAKVAPRTASAILNEMDAEKAARLATIMAGLSHAAPAAAASES